MDTRKLIANIKLGIEKVMTAVAPYTHFIPESFRHKVSQKVLSAAQVSASSVPAPYVPGMYPYGVNLFGFFKAENGLAQGVKLYAAALEEAKIPHALLNSNFLFWLPQNDTSFDKRLGDKAEYAVNVVHINPDQWDKACAFYPQETFDHHYTIGVWLWELETIPNEWKDYFKYVNEIWAPSRFIADALQKETDLPVTVMPYGMSMPYDQQVTRADFGLPEDRFLVLTMYDSNSYSSRKNPGAAMAAFKKAFQDIPKDALLVIKVNNPKEEDLAFIRETMGDENSYILMTERMDKPRLNALIRLCDVFISLHRSEGFGLVMAEAMALGRPVVATNWSSNTEFMDDESACMVRYKLIPVNQNYQFGREEHRWADADVEHAAEFLRRLHDDQTYYAQKAEAGYKKITTEFSVAATAKRMKARVDQILAQKQD